MDVSATRNGDYAGHASSAACSGLTVGILYAHSLSKQCAGFFPCHWCGAPCDPGDYHDDPYPKPFDKTKSDALHPASMWVCRGCWLWRKPKITVNFIDGTSWKDKQTPKTHSWWITSGECLAIRERTEAASGHLDQHALYQRLMHPPEKAPFTLALITSGYANYPHRMVINASSSGHTEGTMLAFTYNGVKHHYSIYELKSALLDGDGNGKEPGVRILLDSLGTPPSGLLPKPNPKGGRPWEEEDAKPLRKKVGKT